MKKSFSADLPDDITFNYKMFMDKTTIIYGASGSGKTHIIKDIMFHLSDHIDQIVVIAPTDAENGTFSDQMVPPPLVHHELTNDLIVKLWSRQQLFTSIYNQANNIQLLKSLFAKLNLHPVEAILEKARTSKAEKIANIQGANMDSAEKTSKIKEIESIFDSFFAAIYKNYIAQNKKYLRAQNLTTAEMVAVDYVNMKCPRLLVVFDDCSAEFPNLKGAGKEALNKMFFQGRWGSFTIILTMHADKILDTRLRDNAYVSIFTTTEAIKNFTKHGSGGFTKATIKKIDYWSDNMVINDRQKLMFSRIENKFYKFTAPEHEPFTFGDEKLKQLCKLIGSTECSIDKSNMFYKYVAK